MVFILIKPCLPKLCLGKITWPSFGWADLRCSLRSLIVLSGGDMFLSGLKELDLCVPPRSYFPELGLALFYFLFFLPLILKTGPFLFSIGTSILTMPPGLSSPFSILMGEFTGFTILLRSISISEIPSIWCFRFVTWRLLDCWGS